MVRIQEGKVLIDDGLECGELGKQVQGEFHKTLHPLIIQHLSKVGLAQRFG